MKSELILNNSIINNETVDLQSILADAHKKKLRPLCNCSSAEPPMYIAYMSGKYLVKRMPGSGKDHHSDCESYEIPAELSGRGELEDSAINEDKETGNTKLKLDFSTSKMLSNRSAPVQSGEPQDQVKADSTKLSILSFLHLLYEDAALNKWNINTKHSWFSIREGLYQACETKVVKNKALKDSLYIPETFKLDNKDAIERRRKTFLSDFKPEAKKQNIGVLIGEIKAIESARYGYKLIIKHMPSAPVFMSEDVFKKINKNFPFELSMFNENERIHLLTVCAFLLTPSGNLQVETISFMTVDKNWIPFSTIEEFDLIQSIYDKKRSFIKGLRYNLSQKKVIASLVFTDCEKPQALYLIPPKANDEYYQELDNVINDSDLDSIKIDLNDDEYSLDVLLAP